MVDFRISATPVLNITMNGTRYTSYFYNYYMQLLTKSQEVLRNFFERRQK